MTTKNSIQGGAYEFACFEALHKELGSIRKVSVVKDERYVNAQEAWKCLPDRLQKIYEISAMTAVKDLFMMEPIIFEGDDALELKFQKDRKGEEGDVRDILIMRETVSWEIGLSIKHNHFAVKHSRLAEKLDFCNSWFHIPCSDSYWQAVSPVFAYLAELQSKGVKFSDIKNKDEVIYIPILEAFSHELQFQYNQHKEIPSLLVEYLLGRFDFYKIVSVDAQELTMIQAYNLHGTLNKRGVHYRPHTIVPVAELPTRIICMGFKPDSSTTVELYMDNGWTFTFRIHNAATICEPSLKFDIQIVGMPTNIICIRTAWKINS